MRTSQILLVALALLLLSSGMCFDPFHRSVFTIILAYSICSIYVLYFFVTFQNDTNDSNCIFLFSRSSDRMPAKVSGFAGTACDSYILKPDEHCDAAKCQKDCGKKVQGGVGTCYGRPYYKGCACQYCPPTLPRKLNHMN